MKSRTWSVVLPILLLGIAALTPPAAEGQGATVSSRPAQQQQFPGRYRGQGVYRGAQQSQQHHGQQHHGQPWQPSYYHQNQYYQVVPHKSFTGNLSRSNLNYQLGYNIAPLTVYAPPVYGYPQAPQAAPPAPPAAPQPAPQPQIYIVQPPAAPAVAPAPAPPPQAPRAPVSKEPGKVIFSIEPEDAQVVLEDRLLGDGTALLDRGSLSLRPGVYVLEVTHPNFRNQRLIFGINPGETTQVAIDLTSDQAHRRARVQNSSDQLIF